MPQIQSINGMRRVLNYCKSLCQSTSLLADRTTTHLLKTAIRIHYADFFEMNFEEKTIEEHFEIGHNPNYDGTLPLINSRIISVTLYKIIE